MDNEPIPMRTNMLTDKTPLTPGTCEYCGNDCQPDDVACSLSCEAQLNRLEALQGRAVIRALKRWRMKPNHAARNAAVAEVVPVVDRFLRSDRKRRERHGEERRAMAALAKEEAKRTAEQEKK